MIRLVIIDDEELARSRVRRLASAHADLLVVGEGSCGITGEEVIREHTPDLIILDIDMPGLDGFELIRSDFPRMPVVIFSTAYPNYALSAFEVDAVDYLLKPYNQNRFDQALSKARAALAGRPLPSANHNFLSRLEVIQRGILHQVALDRVTHVEAFGNYLKLHTSSGFFVHRMALSKLEVQLDPTRYLRVHRSFIINTSFVDSISYQTKGEYSILLSNGIRLISGRKYQRNIVHHTKVHI
ncbi:MAG: LytTR family DNA-binding domain-containing protein [Bacteroidota bacterium]